ncbi:125 kDa kinesin-related protein [Apostasia shenzhenica]|uniref:Kinesin-like protein n=1 Tax=Apostasia shenzhenica TaxID=1088818 RepID=A0A2I0BDD4_9ASPA|nr:125 kDa kinesin-related protein [Apostasia shenzhenica]
MSTTSRNEKEKAVNVQVLLRCRPFNEDELRSNAPQVITCNEFQREVAVSQTIAGKSIDRVFTFDKVFGPSAKQKDLYEQAIVPIVNEVLEGFNCTIFAYGQTGTGKTYTMEGESRKAKNGQKGQLPSDAGVIPRAVKQIFDTLECQNTEYSVKVTFLELYNEEITDLLAPEELAKIVLEEKQKKTLPLMEDGKGGVLVRGLEEEIVTSADEIFSLLERGSSKRRTAETLLNKQSRLKLSSTSSLNLRIPILVSLMIFLRLSRSHSLFSITIHIKEATPEGEELIKCGKLNLVDLAGSENISRSGAREGRAREAGEINKSLLTLGRVITALVEHLGHIPYRDSKLTRLLRDSLGGRTKTCIIATVSPSVHCLEETLSTLDYAHRAKNIKNRPEVNQKMMKSTLIKDLYGEIERLKAEVYATREKVGVYIPKERYYQEEAERKAMAEQIEQMGSLLETSQKQIEDLQCKYDNQLQHSVDLSKKLDATEKSLDHTSKLLSTVKEELQQAQYKIKEKEFIIAEQRKSENALAHQACVLRSDLEKSIQDNSSLFSKIAREDQLNSANRNVVNKFQADLANKISNLCSVVATSVERQNMHLQSVEKLCNSSQDFHERLLVVVEAEANLIFNDLQATLSNYRGEVAQFTRELRERFNTSLNHTKDISCYVFELLDKLMEESQTLQRHSSMAHDVQTECIDEFEKAFKDHSRSEEEKLMAEVATLLSNHLHRQEELVDARLSGFRDAALEKKVFMDKHISSVERVTADAKRKWEEFSMQAQHYSKEGSDFSSAKHCRLEVILQQCANTIETASQQWKKVHESVGEMSTKDVKDIDELVREALKNNEQHEAEVNTAWMLAAEDAKRMSSDMIHHFDTVKENERESISGVVAALEAHSACLQHLNDNHSGLTSEINRSAEATFQQDFMVYEPTGETPVRAVPDLPSKGTIESLRTMPMDALLEEFRENNPYESTKEPKPSLIPRSPLAQLN